MATNHEQMLLLTYRMVSLGVCYELVENKWNSFFNIVCAFSLKRHSLFNSICSILYVFSYWIKWSLGAKITILYMVEGTMIVNRQRLWRDTGTWAHILGQQCLCSPMDIDDQSFSRELHTWIISKAVTDVISNCIKRFTVKLYAWYMTCLIIVPDDGRSAIRIG